MRLSYGYENDTQNLLLCFHNNCTPTYHVTLHPEELMSSPLIMVIRDCHLLYPI